MNSKLVKFFIFPWHEKLRRRNTLNCLRELEKLQWADPEDIRTLQFKKLKALLIHAHENTAFYRRCFREAGFDPENMTSLREIEGLPLLSKAGIRQNLETMLWNEVPGGLHRYNTGGSSGEPLIFYFDRRRQAYDKAARIMTHRWWDVDLGDREFYLWGSPLEMAGQDRLKQLRDRLTNEYLYSAFEISKEEITAISSRLYRFRPKCLFGYPSTISLFCSMALEQGVDLSRAGVRVVFTTAEVLYEHQKETISRALGGVPVVDSYGSREGGFVNHQCPAGTYHVMDPNYILEFVTNEGQPAEPGEDGEIVITHLDAWGMPFIRYRTGDVARPGSERCSCGRGFSTMADIRGRTTDFIVTPDGRWQHALSLIYVVRDIEGVDEFKIIQDDEYNVRVLLKIDPDVFSESGPEVIIKGFKKRMGQGVNVMIDRVEEIPRDASGKYRYVVSKVGEVR
ncbi:MAG: phenylacetate--CoA ligase family protein [Desulfurivibrionaceae bacterium]